ARGRDGMPGRWPISGNFGRGIWARSRQLGSADNSFIRGAIPPQTRGLTPFHALTIGPPACEAAGGRARRGAQARSGKRFRKTRFLNVTAVRTQREKGGEWAQGQPVQHYENTRMPPQE